MKNIQVDSAGELHCWNCGAKAFTQKRTFRAKAIGVTAGVATLGVAGAVAPLATKKKLKCQVCGKYNDVGSADPYTPDVGAPQPLLSGDPVTYGEPPTDARHHPVTISQPIEAKGYNGTIIFDGAAVIFERTGFAAKATGLKPSSFPISDVVETEWKEPTMLTNGHLRFRLAGETWTKPVPQDQHAILVTKQQRGRFDAILDALRATAP